VASMGEFAARSMNDVMPLPNEMRLSCGATLYGAQTQFYPRGRAPAASGAC